MIFLLVNDYDSSTCEFAFLTCTCNTIIIASFVSQLRLQNSKNASLELQILSHALNHFSFHDILNDLVILIIPNGNIKQSSS